MADRTITLRLTPEEAETVAEALDSHLYWQVNEDHARRDSGFILEPYTDDEQAVVDLTQLVEEQIREQRTLASERPA